MASCFIAGFHSLIAHAPQRGGHQHHDPVHVTSVRAEIPISKNHPLAYAPRAIVSIDSPKSAENTRPRKRSSVFSCNNVVENTHTVAPPRCANAAQKHACQTLPDFPMKT